jgi:hypothetical protein
MPERQGLYDLRPVFVQVRKGDVRLQTTQLTLQRAESARNVGMQQLRERSRHRMKSVTLNYRANAQCFLLRCAIY